MLMIFKPLAREGLHKALRAVSTMLMDSGAVLRDIENLGHRTLPYRMRAPDREYVLEGNYFCFDMELPPQLLSGVSKELSITDDVVRYTVSRHKEGLPHRLNVFNQSVETRKYGQNV